MNYWSNSSDCYSNITVNPLKFDFGLNLGSWKLNTAKKNSTNLEENHDICLLRKNPNYTVFVDLHPKSDQYFMLLIIKLKLCLIFLSLLTAAMVTCTLLECKVQVRSNYKIGICCFSAQHATVPSHLRFWRRRFKNFQLNRMYNWLCLFVCLMVFNATFNNISVISWQSVLLVEESRWPAENYRSVASHWQINVVHLSLIEIRTHNISGDRH